MADDPRRELESALAFVLQSHERLLTQRRAEDVCRRVLRPSHSVIRHAEEATTAAAVTLDAACEEFVLIIIGTIKNAVMAAEAAKEIR